VRSELPTITTTDTAAHQFLTSTSPVWTSESSFQSSRVVRIDARQAAVSGPAEPEDGSAAPRFVVNGEDDFEHAAAAAIMVYDPNHPERPGWRSMCGAALVHRRDMQTAGHCIQFVEADLALGRTHAAWISFQQDPLAHFSADPAVADPATGGWYEIASLHNNPDNVGFIELRQSDPADILLSGEGFTIPVRSC
jgi:hypothetical protein